MMEKNPSEAEMNKVTGGLGDIGGGFGIPGL